MAARLTARTDSPVKGTGWKPASSCELQAVGSLRWNSGYSTAWSEIRSYAWFQDSCCSSPSWVTAVSSSVRSSAYSGESAQAVRVWVQTFSPYHQFMSRSGSTPNTDGSPGAMATV